MDCCNFMDIPYYDLSIDHIWVVSKEELDGECISQRYKIHIIRAHYIATNIYFHHPPHAGKSKSNIYISIIIYFLVRAYYRNYGVIKHIMLGNAPPRT